MDLLFFYMIAVAIRVGFAAPWADINTVFLDPDDALRLVRVRDFLAGKGWFDPYYSRIAFDDRIVDIWSRLADAPLAGLIKFFRLFTDAVTAERLAMYVWPLLLLLLLMAAIRKAAVNLYGRRVAFAALAFTALSLNLYGEFRPGRIDHHALQITLIAWLLACPYTKRGAVFAGLLAGVLPIVGIETLPYLLVIACGFGLSPHARRFGAAFAVAVGALYFLTVAPAQYLATACDNTLNFNYIAPLFAAGVLTALIGGGVRRLILIGGITFLAWLRLEPACLHGPYAQTLEPMRHLIVQVMEMRPLSSQKLPEIFSALVMPLLLLPALFTVRGRAVLRRPQAVVLIVMMTIAGTGAFAAVRMTRYLDLPAIILYSGFYAAAGNRLLVRLAILLLPFALTLSIPESEPSNNATTETKSELSCASTASYAALRGLPVGNVAAFIGSGPIILAASEHRIFTGWYQRLGPGLVITDRLFRASPQDAQGLAAAAGIKYAALCKKGFEADFYQKEATNGLAAQLINGTVPLWIKKIDNKDSEVLLFGFNF